MYCQCLRLIHYLYNEQVVKIQKEKLVIILTVLIDVLGMGIVIPVMPFYLQNFGASPLTITLLFSVFSLCAFLSSPILGALSDKIGRRPVLLISILSTAIGWFVFASANVLWILFLGRIIDGLAAGNIPTAQSYLSDLSKTDKERSANLGMIGAIFGIGFIVGPAIGAVLALVSPSFPFWFVGVLATINLIAAYFFLPESHHNRNQDSKISLNPVRPIAGAFKDKALRSRYLAWFLYGMGLAAQQAIFALYLNWRFGFTAAITGYIMTAMGIALVIKQGFLLKNFWLKKFKESTIEVWFFLAAAISFLILIAPSFVIFSIGLIIMITTQSVIRVVMSSRAAGIAGHQRRGEVMGIMSSVLSASMVVGPLVAGLLSQTHKLMPFIFAAFSIFLAFIVMKRSQKEPEDKYEELPSVPEAL